MQAILETNMLCKPTTLVSIVSETRLARRHTVRAPDKHSLQPPSGLAGRSCASSADAHPFSKAECKRSEDTHAMQANVVGVCRFRNEIGKKKCGKPFDSTASSISRVERCVHKKECRALRQEVQIPRKTIVAHHFFCIMVPQRVIRA